ncbi:hypothetical protein GOBAR_DD36231 [Gossypium barbadense]|nr:hypothetical protein GOBAR_DD36231 [Gossypium barbadense]
MEEDEEIQSYPSVAATGSSSPSSPSPASNSRITVTVAAAPPPNSPPTDEPHEHEKAIVLALPPPQKPKSNGGGREDCWSEGATEVLIDAWGERYLELSRGNLKQKHWKEVADIVSSREDYTKTPKTDIQCKNRIDTVKKKYKLEKAKVAAGGGPSKWVFFEKLDQLIGPTAKNQRKQGPVDMDSEDDDDDGDDDADSFDSLPPPPTGKRARRVVHNKSVNAGEKRRKWGNSVKELTQAILRFGEAYEQAETAKLQQVVEMEKQRMKFAKELELQRMQFFMKTQLEISQLKQGKKGVGHQKNGVSDYGRSSTWNKT